LDFGIAHINRPEDPGKTLAGVAMGTPAFMPPEQASARWDEVDARSDLWALGASMFTMLTGRYVHEGGTVNESLVLAVTQKAPPIETVEPDLPQPICDLVNRALQRNKADRFANATDMQLAVRQAYRDLQDGSVSQRYSITDGRVAIHSAPPFGLPGGDTGTGAATGDPVSADVIAFKTDPKSRRTYFIGAAVLALFATAGFFFTRSEEKPKPRLAAQPVASVTPQPAQALSEVASVSPPPLESAKASASSAADFPGKDAGPEGDPDATGADPLRKGAAKPGSLKPIRAKKHQDVADPFAQRE
jgi:serine/threonine-protein kinase